MSRPALLPVKHVLAFPNSLEHQKLKVNPSPTIANGSAKVPSNGVASTSPLVEQKTLEDKVAYLYERQRIIDLLNEYAYTLDSTSMDLAVADVWASLFTEDCDATYPFGNHKGREGLPKFAMIAESRFRRMQHMQSNWTVIFESDDMAHARSTCFCTHGTDDNDFSKHFMEGGYYYTSFRRIRTEHGDHWKISNLTLDINWTMGDSLGVNEPRNA